MARGFHRSLDAPSALVLLEPVSSPNQPQTVPRYRAVRTPTHVYIEYETGDTELYDLAADPHQLDSIHDTAPASLVEDLRSLLAGLADCAGESCAVAARR